MTPNEPETLSEVYKDSLADLKEALRWAKGEEMLKAITVSDNKEQKAQPSFAPRPAKTTKTTHKQCVKKKWKTPKTP